jgi:hypothetical protein
MENEKCPNCEGIFWYANPFYICHECGLQCQIKHFPRIVAAMELAMKVHLYHNKDGYLDEVFGGE